MKRLIFGLAATGLLVGVVIGGIVGWPNYLKYKETHGLRQAMSFFRAGDGANAWLCVRQVLRLNPTNQVACGLMADLAEAARSPSALEWRLRLVELAPTIANRLKLAGCAFRWEHAPYSLAARTLQEFEPSERDCPTYHVLAGELALKLNRIDEAIVHFEAARRLEPANGLHRLNLAVLQLTSTNGGLQGSARAELESLSADRHLSRLALRWLVADDLRRNDFPGAAFHSDKLVGHPGAQLEDRLQHLGVLQRQYRESAVSSAGLVFADYLHEIQAGAVTNVVDCYAVCDWMGAHGLASDALKWVAACEPKLRDAQPIHLAVANLYAASCDWRGLETLLEKQNWSDLEFLRQALLARAAWSQNHFVSGQALWAAALRSTTERLGPLTLLLSLAGEWGRDPEDVLCLIVRKFPQERWALRELERRYFALGNTRGLNSLYASFAESKAGAMDWTNQNNLVGTSLLLSMNLPRAHAAARALYREHPQDVVIAATYAYSRHLQGSTAEGLAVLDRFKPDILETQAVALYYGVLLARAGDASKARHYLALAEKVRMLPEEQRLLAQAKEILNFEF